MGVGHQFSLGYQDKNVFGVQQELPKLAQVASTASHLLWEKPP